MNSFRFGNAVWRQKNFVSKRVSHLNGPKQNEIPKFAAVRRIGGLAKIRKGQFDTAVAG